MNKSRWHLLESLFDVVSFPLYCCITTTSASCMSLYHSIKANLFTLKSSVQNIKFKSDKSELKPHKSGFTSHHIMFYSCILVPSIIKTCKTKNKQKYTRAIRIFNCLTPFLWSGTELKYLTLDFLCSLIQLIISYHIAFYEKLSSIVLLLLYCEYFGR